MVSCIGVAHLGFDEHLWCVNTSITEPQCSVDVVLIGSDSVWWMDKHTAYMLYTCVLLHVCTRMMSPLSCALSQMMLCLLKLMKHWVIWSLSLYWKCSMWLGKLQIWNIFEFSYKFLITYCRIKTHCDNVLCHILDRFQTLAGTCLYKVALNWYKLRFNHWWQKLSSHVGYSAGFLLLLLLGDHGLPTWTAYNSLTVTPRPKVTIAH